MSAPGCLVHLHAAGLGEKFLQLVIIHAEGQVANKDAVSRSLGSRHLLRNLRGHVNWAGQGGVQDDGTECWMDGWMERWTLLPLVQQQSRRKPILEPWSTSAGHHWLSAAHREAIRRGGRQGRPAEPCDRIIRQSADPFYIKLFSALLLVDMRDDRSIANVSATHHSLSVPIPPSYCPRLEAAASSIELVRLCLGFIPVVLGVLRRGGIGVPVGVPTGVPVAAE